MNLQVAYLVNQYPAVSHTFIRREIRALERRGLAVQRIALRGWDATVVDDEDRRERELTRYVLQRGAWPLIAHCVRELVRSPRRWLRAARLCRRMSRVSSRPALTHFIYLAEACVIRRWLAEQGAIHLHAHFATNPAEIAMLVRELGGPPYSFTAHGSDINDRPAEMGLDLTVGRAAFAVAVCSFGRGQLYKWIPPALWRRVHVVRCGLEAGYGNGAPRAPGQALVCVGRLSKEKGQLLLIEAARQLVAEGLAPRIVLAGDGPLRGDIDRLIAQHGLGAHVHVTGWLDAQQVQDQLRQARALVVPSLSEGLPVVVMEAMAHRVPVVAPWLAGIPELVQAGATGWLYPVADTSALADALRACLACDDAAWTAMGQAAHERVWKMHHVDLEAERLAGLFQASSLQDTPVPTP